MQVNQGYIVSGILPNRVDKTLVWLEHSRNKWKEKCLKAKLLLKRQTFTTKRLIKGRNEWKLSAIQFKEELSQSKKTISVLQQHIKKLESEVEVLSIRDNELKKKSSHTI
jgi:hypothetical protein